MKFKNITKKNINILFHGAKITIKPNQIVEGDKEIFSQYRGLLKIINKSIPAIEPLYPPQIEEIIIEENDAAPYRKVSDIVVDYLIVEVIS
jgi:hypothetical protein